jgi:hypothetical protein
MVSEVYHARHRDEHTDEAQAVALGRTFILALATGKLPLVAWYRINDLPPNEEVIGDDNNRHLGVRSVSGASKPALATFAMLTRWFHQPYRILEPTVRLVPDSASPVQVHAFALRDGRQIVAAWLGTPASPTSENQTPHISAELPPDMRRTNVHVSLSKTRVSVARITNAMGKPISDEGEAGTAADQETPLESRVTWRNVRGAVELDLQLRGGELLFCELRP